MFRRQFWLVGCVLALGVVPGVVSADVRLPRIFSDHMVLQEGAAVPIWGWADPGEGVGATLGNRTEGTVADAQGRWRVTFRLTASEQPATLIVRGKNEVTVRDVLIGEVWLGSGQSNMAMTVNRALHYEQEQADARFPQLRMFTVRSGAAATAQQDCQGEWVVCSPETVGGFSATAYFFGRELHRALGKPVGLINSSVGGTPIESWISPDAQQASPELKAFFDAQRERDAQFDPVAAKAQYDRQLANWQKAVAKAKAEGTPPPRKPQDPIAVRERKGGVGGLFNGKIAPLVPYGIRGVIWYQGEANSSPDKNLYYRHQLPLLVKDWRARWGAELPFAWVQLPNFIGAGRGWPEVREAMLEALSLPQTGMAITLDIGDPQDIHPKNKQDVGRRLAFWALGTVYGKDVTPSGPLPAGAERRGREVVCRFRYASGLKVRGDALAGFELAGADGAWQPAEARVDGETVVVSHPDIAAPQSVRYAWANDPPCTLFNAADLPASPFRAEVR